MATQKEALQELLDLVEKKASRELMLDVLSWVCRNVKNKTAVIELERPMVFYTLKEQWALKDRLAKSFAASLVASGYDSYSELNKTELRMNVLMIDPDQNAPALTPPELVKLGYRVQIEDQRGDLDGSL